MPAIVTGYAADESPEMDFSDKQAKGRAGPKLLIHVNLSTASRARLLAGRELPRCPRGLVTSGWSLNVIVSSTWKTHS
jgi:hypothetical protein